MTIGGLGPFTLTLSGPPADLATCRAALETALRAASPESGFRARRVLRGR